MAHIPWTVVVSDTLRDIDGLQVEEGDDDHRAVPIWELFLARQRDNGGIPEAHLGERLWKRLP